MPKDNQINLYLSNEEKEHLDDVCSYLEISRAQLLRIISECIYQEAFLYNSFPNEDVANKFDLDLDTVQAITGR